MLPNREAIVVDKLISKYQAAEYILTLPISFVQRAFGIKPDQVDVVDDAGVCYKVHVRSKPSRPRECYFAKGWRPFSQHHMLRTGSAIRLMHLQFSAVTQLLDSYFLLVLLRDPNPIHQMDQKFDSVKDLSLISKKNWCIKVKILRMWKVPSYEKSYSQPSMELVVIDKDGTQIHFFIRSVHYRLFEPILEEGKVFVVGNFAMDSNTQKYRPTKHSMRIIFKRDTLVSGADDMDIPIESFDFVATKEILSSVKDDLYLIDFVGLLSTKSELIPFEYRNRKSHYMKIELDDLSGSEKLSCTLWENYASELITLLDANKATEFIIVLQFAKMKFYNGVMTITNTNYTTRLMVNADLEVVKKFRQKLIRLGSKHSTSVEVIGRVVRHSPSEDFLSLTPYATIHQIKETLEKSTFVTCGTVIDIDRDHAWWYKACRQCTQGLEALTNQFYCAKCDVYSTIFAPRFCIQVCVGDESDTATFVLFENCASKFLGLTAAEIRTRLLARLPTYWLLLFNNQGYGRDHFPNELNTLIGRTLLFKLTVRHDSLNKFQQCVITVSRICSDPDIISSLALEKNIKLVCVVECSTEDFQLPLLIQINDLVGSESILGVPGSTTTPSPNSDAVSGHGAAHVVTHTPVKRVCIRSGGDFSSRATPSASKSLLPAFESCVPGNVTNPDAGDI
ncbi:replication protein A 70 kDa DNA-binding subunit B-like [Arachis duranensis]|uniref:Replication protein A 70 kDa DNA-binding subunit B-like n=1 Tax=Arachis duranensis TaxID=130453 RepID=A0A6P4B1N1_ARADU|nr:replication protein A 70 kDa DNA-binding subunit B-like [Arachis duranensis]